MPVQAHRPCSETRTLAITTPRPRKGALTPEPDMSKMFQHDPSMKPTYRRVRDAAFWKATNGPDGGSGADTAAATIAGRHFAACKVVASGETEVREYESAEDAQQAAVDAWHMGRMD